MAESVYLKPPEHRLHAAPHAALSKTKGAKLERYVLFILFNTNNR